MVAMPYILVNIILDLFSLALFSMTSVALLSRSRFVGRWLSAQLRGRPTLTLIVTQGLVLVVLSIVAMRVVARLRYVSIFSLPLFDGLFFVGALNCAVLAYQFLDRRYFLSMPKIPRRLLIALCSTVLTGIPLLAIVIAVVGLFVIK